MKKIYLNSLEPSQEQLNSLLEYYQTKQYADAEKLSLSITQEFPKHQFAWKILAVVLKQNGSINESLIASQKSVELDPQDAKAHNNLGVILKELGRLEEAEASLRQAITLKPDYAGAHYNLGNTLQKLGRLDEAEASYTQAIALKPNYVEAYSNLGNIMNELGRLDEAGASFTQVITLKPDYAEAHNNLGITLEKQGRLKEAEASYRKAITLKPDYAEAHSNLCNTLKKLGRLDEAKASFTQAITLKPDYAEAHNNLGTTLKKLGRLDEAKASFTQAITLKPDLAEAHNNLGNIMNELGRLEEGETSYRKAIELKPDYTKAHSNLLFLYSGFMYESSHYLKKAREYGQQIAKSVVSKYSTWLCVGNTKILRVGMVSGDLKNHPVGYFLEEFLNQLGEFDFELYAYTTQSNEDDLTLRIKPGFTRWKSLVGISDVDAADHIYNDGIHILIDLSGHTAQNRLPIFAWKPAPVQISWLGYFASTGVAEIDYILGDPYVTPTEEANHFIEKIWQLPESYICFTEPEVDIDVMSLPALDKKRVTFGCFNKIARITDPVVRVWSEILHAVPTAVLFLKDKYFEVESVRDSFYDRFKVNGIQKDRLILEGLSPRSKYLAAYNRVDIALSPFPYGGGTTSAEGLWMGVPVITMQGNHFLSHLGESIANNTGLSDWIAVDEEDYVAKAIAFSTNLEGLEKLRSRLRAQVLSRPLFDAERFANHFKNALRGMWKCFEERDKSNS
jgi:protein O-GlcNAc transferase